MTYADLVAEVALRCGLPEVPARAAHFVTQAERDLEKALRVRQMEAAATLTAGPDGKAALPADYLAIRSDGKHSWAIVGNDIIAQPDQVIGLAYYAKLPSVVTGGTNWLLDLEPEIYLNAVLMQAYAAQADDRAAVAAAVLNERIRAFKREDAIARYNGQKIAMVTP